LGHRSPGPACIAAQGQKMPPMPPPSGPAVPPAPAQNAPTRITLDEALRLAVQHNHALQAARTMVLQNQAEEVTANLRPNPTLLWDSQFFPLFNPSQFTADYISNQAQFDAGISYLFERGKKRQHRLQAAKDTTAVSLSEVADNERQLIFNTGSQFVTALLAQSTQSSTKPWPAKATFSRYEPEKAGSTRPRTPWTALGGLQLRIPVGSVGEIAAND
jgi:outer membrane protein TolC